MRSYLECAMNHPYLKPRFPTENYLNRELGLLAFNRRVLAQAEQGIRFLRQIGRASCRERV